jgi:hypothetical protein
MYVEAKRVDFQAKRIDVEARRMNVEAKIWAEDTRLVRSH